MSCYLRHLKEIMGGIGIDPENKEDKKRFDNAVRKALGMEDAQCNHVWAKLKELGLGDKALWAKVKKGL